MRAVLVDVPRTVCKVSLPTFFPDSKKFRYIYLRQFYSVCCEKYRFLLVGTWTTRPGRKTVEKIIFENYSVRFPVPGIKGTLGNKRYLCFQLDILEMTYQLSTPQLTAIQPIVAAGSTDLKRLIGTARSYRSAVH